MGITSYKIEDNNILINGRLTYEELEGSDSRVHGLLFNARFIQGVFEDVNPENATVYNRFGMNFDKDENTERLINSLPSWYEKGLRAITVGIQGGGPILTFNDWSCIDTNAFSKDGKTMNEGIKKRLQSLIEACDRIGMLVIVSVLYQAQLKYLDGGSAMVQAVKTTCDLIRENQYTNVILEIANEHDICEFTKHPLFASAEGMQTLIELSRGWLGEHTAIGCSCCGGIWEKELCDASDIILIHGNGLHREEYYRMIKGIQAYCSNKPIVCNEDSPRFSQLTVSYDTHTSWGYYNNFTKQEPPTDWEITKGEDTYFTERLMQMIYQREDSDNEFYLQGFEENMDIQGGYYVRLASRYPEKVNYVRYYENGRLLDIAYAEPFMMYSITTWQQRPYVPSEKAVFTAEVFLHNGDRFEITHKF